MAHSVLLFCPHCKKEKRVAPLPNDPAGTVRISVSCPECDPEEKALTPVIFFNAEGARIKEL
jgi:hypothetical protein